ncbi:MAG: GTP-binding protein [Alphaproteobacteria bacterium]|nr:MAG: GTP-binding protein [Alphaproteobacteria bacterium]
MRHFPSPDIGMFGRRQRHARAHRIPVRIVTRSAGALSPGTAIVIDRFGADDVMPLPGSCPCCTVRDKLQIVLRELLAERANQHQTGVVIETNNELGPILRTFATERALGAEFYVEDAPDLPGADVHQFVLTHDAPLSWDAFCRFMTTLTALRGPDLLLMKGLLNVVGCRGPVGVQCMGHLAARPVELQAWPAGERASRLEFVTRGFDAVSVRAMFDAVRALLPG